MKLLQAASGGTITYASNDVKANEAKNLWFHPLAWLKLTYLRDTFGLTTEFTCYGTHHSGDPFSVMDIWLPPQVCTGSTTKPDLDAAMAWLCDPEHPNRRGPIIWIHTHPNMGAGPSGTDTNTLDELAKGQPAIMAIFACNDARSCSARLRCSIPVQQVGEIKEVYYIEKELVVTPYYPAADPFYTDLKTFDFSKLREMYTKNVTTPVHTSTHNNYQNGYHSGNVPTRGLVQVGTNNGKPLNRRARKAIKKLERANRPQIERFASLNLIPWGPEEFREFHPKVTTKWEGSFCDSSYYNLCSPIDIATSFIYDAKDEPEYGRAARGFRLAIEANDMVWVWRCLRILYHLFTLNQMDPTPSEMLDLLPLNTLTLTHMPTSSTPETPDADDTPPAGDITPPLVGPDGKPLLGPVSVPVPVPVTPDMSSLIDACGAAHPSRADHELGTELSIGHDRSDLSLLGYD
jgi:hypothetical protein